jgi:hypothetical protein
VADGVTLSQRLLDIPLWNEEKDHRRLLVLWGHGAQGLRDPVKKFAVPAAEEVVAAFSGSPGGRPPAPHVIGYDACRMASATTVLTLARGLSDAYFIGSMIPEPVSGWPYADLLRILTTTSEPKAAAAAIVQAYAASVDVPDWCLIALELKRIVSPEGTTALNTPAGDLASALAELEKFPPSDEVDFFAAASGADTLDDTNLVDLGALMRRLTDQTTDEEAARSLQTAAAGVRTAIREATIARRASGNLGGRDGLSVLVEVPPTKQTDLVATQPRSGWHRYLEPELFSKGAAPQA